MNPLRDLLNAAKAQAEWQTAFTTCTGEDRIAAHGRLQAAQRATCDAFRALPSSLDALAPSTVADLRDMGVEWSFRKGYEITLDGGLFLFARDEPEAVHTLLHLLAALTPEHR